EDFANIDAGLTIRFAKACPVAHQPADFRRLTQEIDRRHSMIRRQRDKLYATVVEQRRRTDQERISLLLRKAREDRIDFKTAAGVQDFDLLPDSQSRSPDT